MALEEITYDQVETGDGPGDPLGLRKRLQSANQQNADPIGLRAKLNLPKQVEHPAFKLSEPTFRATPSGSSVAPSVPNEKINIQKSEIGYIPDERSYKLQQQQGKAKVAHEKVNAALVSSDSQYEKKLRESRRDNFTIDNLRDEYERNGQILSPQDEQKVLQKEKDRLYNLPITKEELTDFKTGTILTPKLSRKFIKDLNDKDVAESAYQVDKFNELANDPDPNAHNRIEKINEVARGIKKGTYVYDPESKTVVQPIGLIGSLMEGVKNKHKADDEHDFLKNTTNDAAIISQLEDERNNPDLDTPVKIPKGKIGEVLKSVAEMPVLPMIAGAVGTVGGTFIGNPEIGTVAATALGAYENRKAQFTSTFKQVYNEMRDQGKPEFDALTEARKQAENAQEIGTVVGAAQGYLGAKIGAIPVKGSSFNLGYQKAIGDFLKKNGSDLGKIVLDAAAQGGLAAAGEITKNKLAQAAGIKRDWDENTENTFWGNALMTAGIGAAIKVGRGMSKINYKTILSGLTKSVPEETINSALQEKISSGEITQAAADQALSEINQYKEKDAQIPANVTEEARFKIQDNIDKINELQTQKEATHESLQGPIKERIQKLVEDNLTLSKETIKEEKPVSGLEKSKEKEAIDFAHELVDEGVLPDTYGDEVKKDPIKFWQTVAQQAQNRDENWKLLSNPLDEQSVRDNYGDTVVDYAKELFPAPEIAEVPKSVSVIQPGEIKQPETITIKPQENAQAIRGDKGEIQVEGDVGGQRPNTRSENIQLDEGATPINAETQQQAGVPTQENIPEGQERVETPEQKQMAALTMDDTYGLPFIEESGDKRTGIKNIISKVTRFERRLPPVEVGKLGSDQEVLLHGKDLVDNNVIDPVSVVNRILDTKEGMQPDEAKAMQYYMHQLDQQDVALREKLASASDETEQAEINGQLQQLSDELDAATQANIISGKAWSDVGNIRQIVADTGFNASRDLATIKDAYGGKIPKDVQAKLDVAFKERDEAKTKLAKLQADQNAKAAEDTIKKQGAPKSSKKTKEQFNNERNEIKQSISDKLKQARSGESGLTAVPLPFAKELIAISPEIYKMIKSYAEEGIQKTEDVINRLHDILKDEIDGLQKSDIVNLLAGKYKDEERKLSPISQRIRDYRTEASLWGKIAEATKMEEDTPKKKEEKNEKLAMLRDRLNEIKTRNKEAVRSMQGILATDEQKEMKRLTRQRRALESKYKNKTYLVPKEEAKTPFSEEIFKEKQRIVNANYKIRIEKRKAFESQKSMYQKGLMWLGKGVRLSVLSGYNVLAKLAAAAVVGGGVKRIPEQAIGFVYGNAFKGISEKAPIEGFVNASAEAKFYKEFLNPKTFAKNTWEILKSGESPLSKKFSPGTYEHIPGIYLPTDLHQVIKDPLKRATYEASLKNALAWAERNGMDINDDLVIQSLETAAYKRAQYEIFQEQNWLSKKFGEWKHNMEEAGNLGATGKFLADFMIPVSTVPTNIARRMAITSPFGLIKGAGGVVEAYRKGIESLTPEQADSVMRQLKQGTLGTALWLIGWYGYSHFGGLFSKFDPNKKRDEGDLVSDEMSVGGKMIPKPVQHAIPLEIIQFAATARRVYDNYKDNKGRSTPEAIEKAALASIGALSEQIPIVETVAHTIGAFNDPYEAKKLEEDAKRRFEPQILRETGVIKGDKKGIWEEEPKGGGKKSSRTKAKHISHKRN